MLHGPSVLPYFLVGKDIAVGSPDDAANLR